MKTEEEALREEMALLRRQLARERRSREQAEQLAEQGTRALYDRQAELALLAAIASAANSGATLQSAIGAVLQALGEFGGWELGHVYLNEPGTDSLTPLAVWHETVPGRFDVFKEQTGGMCFRRDCGLPGRVMARGEFLLLPDLAQEDNFPRREAAVACGLVSALAFPVVPSLGGMAVIELFSIRPHSPTEPMVGLIPQITAQAARIFARHWIDGERQRIQQELEAKVNERTVALTRTVEELNSHVEQLRRTQQSLQVHGRALNAAANGIVIADARRPGYPIVYCNPAFERLTGYGADEVMGRNCKLLQGDGTEADTIASLREAIREGRPCSVIIRNYRKDGTPFWNQLTVAPVHDPKGELTHYVGVQEDVSRRQEVEYNLRAARDTTELANRELSRAARLKDEFLAAMSHELRTPLNTVLGMTEVLREQIQGPLNPAQLEMLTVVDESGRHLLALINDILDLSKIEAGKFDLQIEEVALEETALAAVRFVREAALRKRLDLDCTVQEGVHTVAADQRRLKQILVNLLSNAVKFTPENGRIGLEVVAEPSTGCIRFTVWDTGIGIAAEDLERLFRPFEQLDSRLARRYEGTGLGLALVQRMVHLHGGEIRVESQPGSGSRFTFNLPVSPGMAPNAETSSASTRATPRPAANGEHVLVVDDNQTNQKLLIGYLEAQGYRTSLATHGEEAVQLATRNHPDLILMDIQMPGMDGLEAIRLIRGCLDMPRVPIIALTALAMSGDRDRCLEAGADEYLSKPVMLSELSQRVGDLLRAQKGARC